MAFTRTRMKLTHAAALTALDAAVKAAETIGRPQNVCIVDEGCNLLAFIRMDDARVLSIESSRKKAETAASYSKPTGLMASELEMKMAFATDGRVTNLGGGYPITFEGQVVGGIGVGGGTAEEDKKVALAALRAVGADLP